MSLPASVLGRTAAPRAALPALAAVALLLFTTAPASASPQGPPGGPIANLTVSGVSPSCGVLIGSTPVIITGTDFVTNTGINYTTVTFGGRAGMNVVVWSSTMLTVQTPPALAPGPVAVVVTTPTATMTLAGAFSYAATCPAGLPVAQLASVSPSRIQARTDSRSLTVTGANFTNASFVTWNGDIRPTTVVDSTRLVATLYPTDIETAGMGQVRVVSPDQQISNFLYVTITPGWRIVGSGDFNRDGTPELVWESSEGYVALWFLNGTSLASSSLLNPLPVATGGWHIKAVGDLNGDGWPDLVWENTATGHVAGWYMAGTSVSHVALLSPGPAAVDGWHVVGAADLSGDGLADPIWQNDSGYVAVWRSASQGPYVGVLLSDAPLAVGGYLVAGATDVNADGMPDLIWRLPNGGVAVWVMNGLTQAAILGPVPGINFTYWTFGASFDLNADRVPDMIFESDAGTLNVSLMAPGWAAVGQFTVLSPTNVY